MEAVSKFKVGDRVRYINPHSTFYLYEGTISQIDKGDFELPYTVDFDEGTNGYWAEGENLELIETAENQIAGSKADIIVSDDVGYPDDNPKTTIGLTKPGFDAIPPVGLIELGAAMADGKRKYGHMNWREKTVSSTVYYNAMLRHLFSWFDGEDRASDSKVHHLGHIMACCAILLDAESTGKINDDRPSFKGRFADEVQARITKQ